MPVPRILNASRSEFVPGDPFDLLFYRSGFLLRAVLQNLLHQLWQESTHKRVFSLDPGARDDAALADKGWDPAYGARPLKRVIQKSVQDPLAEMILAGSVKDGEKVTISAGKNGLSFNGKLAQAA